MSLHAGVDPLLEKMRDSLTVHQAKEQILNRLHESVGICGHCGKRECPHRRKHSVLPEAITLPEILKAIDL